MHVGVIVPTYNRQRLVLEALASIAGQTHAPHRVIVVDDASGDETVPRVREWMAAHGRSPEWQVVARPVNGGVAAARNTGVELASDCDLLAFLDSDDVWHPEMLESAVRAARENPAAVAFVADRWFEDWSRGHRSRIQRFPWVEKSPLTHMIRHGCPTPSCVVVRREAFERAGWWDENLPFMEDVDAMARLALQGPFVNVPRPLVRYRLGVGAAYSEEPAMCHGEEDHALWRARIFERLAAERGYPGITRQRAFCWFRAGRAAYRRRDWALCGQHCARALRLAPWHLRAALLWTRARVRRLAGSNGAA